MKNLIFALFLSIRFLIAFGQDNAANNQLQTLTKLDIGVQGIGVNFEARMSRKITIDFTAGAGGGYDIQSDHFKYKWELLDPAVYVSITPKYFYNRQKRVLKKKTGSLNSGNYIGFRIKYTSPEIRGAWDLYHSLLVNIHWGMQKAIAKRWSFNTHAGVGYGLDLGDLSGNFYPAVDLRFSYLILKPHE